MVNRKKELFTNTIIIGIGNIFTRAISFLLVPFFTLWLTTKEYGDYDLLFSYASLVVPVLTLQLEQAVLRFTLEDKKKGELYFKTGFVYLIASSCLFSLVFAFFVSFDYHISFAFCTVAYAFQIYTTEYLRGRNELKDYSMANIVCGILTVFLSFLFVKVLNEGVDGLLTAFGLSYLLTSIYIILRKKPFQHSSAKLFDRKIFKKLLGYSFPLLPNAISWWITNVSDRTLINIFLGSSFNGIYAVSTKIPTLTTVFYSIFNLAWQQSAIVSSSDNYEKRKEFYNATYKRLFSFLFASSLVIVAVTPFLYQYFLGEEYRQGMNIVPILVLSTVFLNLAQYLGGILLGLKDTKTNGMTTVIAAVVNLVINFVFIAQLGLYAAALSTLASYIVLFVLRLNKVKALFDTKVILTRVAAASLIMLAVSGLTIGSNHLWVQSILFVLAVVYFLYSNRFLVAGILNNLKRR